MPHFLFKKRKTFSVDFSEIENNPAQETPFWETQRAEAVKVITRFYTNWQALWQGTRNALGQLRLSESGHDRLNFYETEQKRTVIHLLAEILIAWEKDDSRAFSNAVVYLARELRPSITHFENDTTEDFSITPAQLAILNDFTTRETNYLKQALNDLQRLSWYKFEFGDKVISINNAEALIKENLGISSFDYLDFSTEPEFNPHGFFPALLQEADELGL